MCKKSCTFARFFGKKVLNHLQIVNYRNIREASLDFSDKLNCFIGLNGQGKTNLLDAIYLLSFTKSAFSASDSQNITHGEEMAMVQGLYSNNEEVQHPTGEADLIITCGLKRGVKKSFRRGKKEYKRLIDHIGLIPLVMVCPQDNQLVEEGSDERRRFLDAVISQQDKRYLENLTQYNAVLKQRNALLKQLEEQEQPDFSLLEIFDEQLLEPAQYIFAARTKFIEAFLPVFQEVYSAISGNNEQVKLLYVSQLQDRDLAESLHRTHQRDIILGWTSQGIHKDELEMLITDGDNDYPLKRVGSQGQQKTYLLAMKLAQALYLSQISNIQSQISNNKMPILLLDDIFDKLDSERVERIVHLVQSNRFGQIFITDTDRQHLTTILKPDESAKIFYVENGVITTSINHS